MAALLAGWSTTAFAAPPERKSIAEKSGERVSRGIIEESLETLDTPENRARLGRILNSPEMRDALRDLTASMVLGVYDGVQGARTNAKNDRELSKSMREAINRRIAPAVGRVAWRMTDSALDAALSDEHITRLEVLGEDATHAAIRGLSTGIEEDLGPALALVVERDLMPALARSLDTPQMQQTIANLSRTLAAEFVGGAGEAIGEETDQGGLQVFGTTIAVGYAIAVFLAFGLGTMSIVLTVVLVRNTRRLRRQSKAAAEREAALMHIIDSLETDQPQLKADVRRLLEDEIAPE
jgi:hypothetical protein